jgi:hypothetical protein
VCRFGFCSKDWAIELRIQTVAGWANDPDDRPDISASTQRRKTPPEASNLMTALFSHLSLAYFNV